MDFYGKMKEERIRRKAMGTSPTYKILQVDQLRQVDKERASAVASFVTSGVEAHRLQGQEGFAYKDLDVRGRVGVVCYKGVEVSLLFKREVVEREPGPSEPIPECILKEPKDAWIQISLMNAEDASKHKGIADRLRSALEQVKRLQMLWSSEQTQRASLEAEVEKWKEEKLELRTLRDRTALLEDQLKSATKEAEYQKAQATKAMQERQRDRVKIVEEMFPVFNTVWLAGQHRVNDQLYGILRKQVMEALSKVGMELIEPAIGDEFDPELHHAVHSYPYPPEAKEIGSVVQIQQVGWKFVNGSVVLAAQVAVGVEQKEATVGGGD